MGQIHKDWVKIASKQCEVCGCIHEHGAELLLHKNMREIKSDRDDGKVITGVGLCEEHDQMFKDGFIALVVVHNNDMNDKDTLHQRDAIRTGEMVHMRRTVFNDMFDIDVPEEQTLGFIPRDLFKLIQSMHDKVH